MRFMLLSLVPTTMLAVYACGGESEPMPPATDAEVESSAPAPDAGSEAATPSSGSDPGRLKCASATCTTSTEVCCLEADSTSADKSCVPVDASACPSLRRECDEAADCASGQKCCEAMHAAPFHIRATMCAPKCEPRAGSPGICKTDAECTPDTCVVVQCRGETVGFCGGPPSDDFCKPPR